MNPYIIDKTLTSKEEELDILNHVIEWLQKEIDEISVTISSFKRSNSDKHRIEAITKMVIWNMDHEERIAKAKREENL